MLTEDTFVHKRQKYLKRFFFFHTYNLEKFNNQSKNRPIGVKKIENSDNIGIQNIIIRGIRNLWS